MCLININDVNINVINYMLSQCGYVSWSTISSLHGPYWDKFNSHPVNEYPLWPEKCGNL